MNFVYLFWFHPFIRQRIEKISTKTLLKVLSRLSRGELIWVPENSQDDRQRISNPNRHVLVNQSRRLYSLKHKISYIFNNSSRRKELEEFIFLKKHPAGLVVSTAICLSFSPQLRFPATPFIFSMCASGTVTTQHRVEIRAPLWINDCSDHNDSLDTPFPIYRAHFLARRI